MSRFHDRTLELLGTEAPRTARSTEVLRAWAASNGFVVPAALLEWAALDDGRLLRKYSNDDRFWIDAPEVIVTPDGARGLLFQEENQGNFQLIASLDGGDDPRVLFGWIGQPPWVEWAAHLSDAIYAQIFDWQYMLESDPADPSHREIAYVELTADAVPCLRAIRSICEETVRTACTIEGRSYAQHRFVRSTDLRLTVSIADDGKAGVRITGRRGDEMDALRSEILSAIDRV